MSDLLPREDSQIESPTKPEGNLTLRVFWRTVLASAFATFVLGLLTSVTDGGSAGNIIIPLLMLSIIGIPVACIVAVIVFTIRGQKEYALGYLLAGLATPLVGFGACMASMLLLNG